MLPIATTAHVGGVKIQPGGALSVAADGTLSLQMRYGTSYAGLISDYRQAQYVGEWLVLNSGVLCDNPQNVATLKVGPSTSAGIRFPVLVDGQAAGSIAFGQAQVTGTFSLTPVALKPGSMVTIGVPDLNVLAHESQASGLVLILVC